MNGNPVAFQLWSGLNTLHRRVVEQTFFSSDFNMDIKIIEKCTFPQRCGQRKCTALSVENVANPHWISVDCDEKLLLEVACQTYNDNNAFSSQHTTVFAEKKVCPRDCIVSLGKCFNFQWNIDDNSSECFGQVDPFLDLLYSVRSSKFPPFFVPSNDTISFQRYVNVHTLHPVSTENISGAFCIVPQSWLFLNFYQNIFQCNDKSLISAQYVCDEKPDCPGPETTDEKHCQCTSLSNVTKMCQFVTVSSEKKKCSPLFENTIDGRCVPYREKSLLSTTVSETHTEGQMYHCTNGMLIHAERQDDLVTDCQPTGEDEHILRRTIFHPCAFGYQIPCREGHSKCFNVSQICTYTLSIEGHLRPCRTGEHLQECKNFECNGMFKCPNYYCVPWHYTCDGK